MSESVAIPNPVSPVRLVRWSLVLIGVVCVGLGALGVLVPGLPTTIFLIIAAWCFTKSCPVLERSLVRNRFFAPFLAYVDRREPMPARAKAWAIGTMWLFSAGASAMFLSGAIGAPWLAAPIIGAAMLGTVVILRWDRGIAKAAG